VLTELEVARDSLGQERTTKRIDLESGQQLFLAVLTTSQESQAMISAVVVIGEHARTLLSSIHAAVIDWGIRNVIHLPLSLFPYPFLLASCLCTSVIQKEDFASDQLVQTQNARSYQCHHVDRNKCHVRARGTDRRGVQGERNEGHGRCDPRIRVEACEADDGEGNLLIDWPRRSGIKGRRARDGQAILPPIEPVLGV
jgi:hypothetical protein